MNRKTMLKHLTREGFTGDTLDEAIKFCDIKGIEFQDGDGQPLPVKTIWDRKTVYLIVEADDGEDVQMVDAPVADEAMADMDEDEEPVAKRRTTTARDVMKGMSGSTGLSAKNWQNIAASKAYTAAARNGGSFRGAKCLYGDADRAAFATAALRLGAFGESRSPAIVVAYAAQKKEDLAIVGKAGSIGNNATYGSTVIEEFAPELIENLNSHGAARLAAGVTSMSRDSLQIHRWGSDVTVTDTAEGAVISVSDGSTDRVGLYAKKTAALGRMSSELLNDSALNIANQWGVSVVRAMAQYEDKSFFLGTGRAVGLVQTAGADADSTYDVQSTTGWAAWTIAELQAAKAKLAPWASEDGNLAIVAHPAFYEAVLKVNAYSAGGTPGDAILNGTTVKAWDGVPFVPCASMPSAYSADQIVAFIGNFTRATKFGVVRGSEQLVTSDDYYFNTDEVALRFTQRWDYNLHDVTGTNTGVIALKD